MYTVYTFSECQHFSNSSIEMRWHPQKEFLKSVGKIRNVLAFAEGSVKKMLTSLEMGWYSQKELLKKYTSIKKSVGKLRIVLPFVEGAVKKRLASLKMCHHIHKAAKKVAFLCLPTLFNSSLIKCQYISMLANTFLPAPSTNAYTTLSLPTLI